MVRPINTYICSVENRFVKLKDTTMSKKLKKETILALMQNALLYGEVANVLKVRPMYMATLVSKNSKRLTEFDSLFIIAKYLGKSQEELIEF